MPLPVQFFNLSEATGQQLDDDFDALGALVSIPCTISGTNLLTLAPVTVNVPTVNFYQNFQCFIGLASATNTGAVQARVGSLALLNVYKNSTSGPVLLTNGEIQASNLIVLTYDSTLNSGAGGFILLSGQAVPRRQLTTTASLTFPSIAPGAITEQAVTVAGVTAGDVVTLGLPTSIAPGIVFQGYVSISNVIQVRAQNVTSGTTITPPAGTFRVVGEGY